MYTLIGTAKLSDVDPQAWLADALHRRPCRQTRTCYGRGVAAEEQPSPSDPVRQSGFPRTFLGRARTKAMRGRTGGLSSETISADEPYDSSTCAKVSLRVSGIR